MIYLRFGDSLVAQGNAAYQVHVSYREVSRRSLNNSKVNPDAATANKGTVVSLSTEQEVLASPGSSNLVRVIEKVTASATSGAVSLSLGVKKNGTTGYLCRNATLGAGDVISATPIGLKRALASAVDLATGVTGVLPIANGGTGNTAGNAVNVTGVIAVANGGTNSSTSLTGNQLMVSSGGKVVELGAMAKGSIVSGGATLPIITAPDTNGKAVVYDSSKTGGLGAQSFVDLTTGQTVGGAKVFTSDIVTDWASHFIGVKYQSSYAFGMNVDISYRNLYIDAKDGDGSGVNGNGSMFFRTGGTPSPRMTIAYGGFVGVGAVSSIGGVEPAYQLEVFSSDIASGSGLRVKPPASFTNIPYPGSIANSAVLSAIGFNFTQDNKTLTTPPTMGIGVAINRTGPAIGVRNEYAAAPAINIEAGTLQIIPFTGKLVLYADGTSKALKELAAGTNGQVLTQDSTAAAGIKWADVPPSSITAKAAASTIATHSGTQTVDGISCGAGDYALELTGANAGLWQCAAGAWTKTSPLSVPVAQGSTNGRLTWFLNSAGTAYSANYGVWA